MNGAHAYEDIKQMRAEISKLREYNNEHQACGASLTAQIADLKAQVEQASIKSIEQEQLIHDQGVSIVRLQAQVIDKLETINVLADWISGGAGQDEIQRIINEAKECVK